MHTQSGIRKIAFIGNYLPRQCGIATFTTSICESVSAQFPDVQCFSVPVTDIENGYDYPERVRFEIKEKDLGSYERAADFLNLNNIDVACLQHEFGIFGGSAGGYILTLLRQLKMPIVTTLHTILKDPNDQQQRVMTQLINYSDRLVVMTHKALELLNETYNVDSDKISLIPHGIIDVPFVDPNFYKDHFGVEGKLVLLTFGLLSPDKGIENVLHALPEIVSKFPNVVYIILGATHPSLLRKEGEAYRLTLQYLAEDLGIENHVIFYNRFVSTEELKEFIGAADIYITPYLKEAQITSGALSYSFGAGKAVISTPYWHAKELLSHDRGVLVPFKSPQSIARAIKDLIEKETERHAMRKNAYLLSREMVWSNVAYLYKKTFEEARHRKAKSPFRVTNRVLEQKPKDLPKIKLDHLFRMSDSTGILRHAIHTVPDYSKGYSTDDNAKALILMHLLLEAGEAPSARISDLTSTYLAFLNYSFNSKNGRFRNMLGYNRVWEDQCGSQECHAKTLWALGTCIGRSRHEGVQNLAGQLFEKALPVAYNFSSPLSWAYTIIGIHEYFRRFDGDRLVNHGRELLAGKLFNLFSKAKTNERVWFDSNSCEYTARLSHALILSGRWLSNSDMLNAGLESLKWLVEYQSSNKNYYHPESALQLEKGLFDQRPSVVHDLISGCLEACRTTQETAWFIEARKVFEWFLGRNEVGLSLYDPKTGGCKDALHVDRVNQNEGAEASLSFYLSLVEMQEMENTIVTFREPINT
ncbi:glycosyltransferase family 4 protein [Chitinispirillales bacterium ANBcel5]|uniref:glycosyltransferase family 4 protein n=1 Tax=Cellulosispirillum alkaliphilum TaxID=3039283 RepID=UPI002A52DDFA|nr:glycosyltransferase family 4 protein [Chitinispirillales bacterium ANBcel5]